MRYHISVFLAKVLENLAEQYTYQQTDSTADCYGRTVPKAQRPSANPGEEHQMKSSRSLKVCIIGAGITGLYIALLLDSLGDLNVSYEILEASPRAGGRVRTHYFSTDTHDYCDTGAMRFPRIPLMKRFLISFNMNSPYPILIDT